MKFGDIRKLKAGDTVFWNDPAFDGSRPYTLKYLPDIQCDIGDETTDTIIALKDIDGGELECLADELMAQVPKLAYNEFGFDPEVGMGGTYGVGSFEMPVTVVEVKKNGKEIHTRWDKVEPGTMGVPVFTPNPTGDLAIWTLRRNGRFKLKGHGRAGWLVLGKRNYHIDRDG